METPNTFRLSVLDVSREDDFEAQMSPFDFLRQEMLRPFEGAACCMTHPNRLETDIKLCLWNRLLWRRLL